MSGKQFSKTDKINRAKENSFEIGSLDVREYRAFLEMRERVKIDKELKLEKRREQRIEINRKIGESKRKKRDAKQLDLF